MEKIARLGLPTEGILILMHVVIFSGDGLDLDHPDFVQEAQVSQIN